MIFIDYKEINYLIWWEKYFIFGYYEIKYKNRNIVIFDVGVLVVLVGNEICLMIYR